MKELFEKVGLFKDPELLEKDGRRKISHDMTASVMAVHSLGMTDAHTSRNFDRKEDELLLEMVSKYGTDSWNEVAAALGNRTARQCHNRYTYYLDPSINSAPWTPEEDEMLKKQYAELGPRWAVMRAFFPGRTDLNIKNRFGFLARNRSDVRELKSKHAMEHRGESSDSESAKRKDQARYDPQRIADLDALFESLAYYVKRCVLLETICADNQIEVPEGVGDEKQWQQQDLPEQDVEPLPPIPEPERQEKQ